MAVNPLISEVLMRKNLGVMSRQSAFWIMINLFLALFIALEMYYGSYVASELLDLSVSLVWKLELGVLVITSLNLSVHMTRYLYPALGYSVVNLTEEQKKLLNVSQYDPAIGSTRRSDQSAASGGSVTPLNMSALSWLSRSDAGLSTSASSWAYRDGSTSRTWSPNSSQPWSPISGQAWSPNSSYAWNPYGSWSHQGSPYGQQHNVSYGQASPVPPMSPLGGATAAAGLPRVSTPVRQPAVDVTDLDSLAEYLAQYEERQRLGTSAGAAADTSGGQGGLWSRGRRALLAADGAVGSPERPTYQLATRMPREPEDEAGAEKEADSTRSGGHDPVWARLDVSRDTLFRWTENLRVWLCQTIFVRLAKEVDAVNAALRRHGLSEVQIGEASLENLRKTALVGQDLPSLNALLHFLSVSTHQEYLVYRVRELSRGGCMQEFRWNGGGTFRGKDWDEHLPTDSAIVMHMVAAYLDARLPPHPSHPDGRTFSSEHVSRTPDKPAPGPGRLVIHQAEITPRPRFCLVVGKEIYELAKGRNNLFHTLLLFLYMIREKHDCMLDRINIGPSGLNMLWIIE